MCLENLDSVPAATDASPAVQDLLGDRYRELKNAYPLWTGEPAAWVDVGAPLVEALRWSASYRLGMLAAYPQPVRLACGLTSLVRSFYGYSPASVNAKEGTSIIDDPIVTATLKDALRSGAVERVLLGAVAFNNLRATLASPHAGSAHSSSQDAAFQMMADLGLIVGRTSGRRIGVSQTVVGKLGKEARAIVKAVREWRLDERTLEALGVMSGDVSRGNPLLGERIQSARRGKGIADSVLDLAILVNFPFLGPQEIQLIRTKRGSGIAKRAAELLHLRMNCDVTVSYLEHRIRDALASKEVTQRVLPGGVRPPQERHHL